MRKAIIAVSFAIACAACTNSVAVQRDQEVVASTRYDGVSCAELASQRDALAARHGLPRDAARQPQTESSTPGFGIFIPDARSEAARTQAQAASHIGAMNRSMERRRCGES